MRKPSSLRAALEAALPSLASDPDKLLVYANKGRLVCTGVPGASFEYRYELELILTDCALDPDTIMVPVLTWLATEQPDALANYDASEKGIEFEADILSNDTWDLSLKLPITEAVVATLQADGSTAITNPLEPPFDPEWQGVIG